MLLLLCSLVFLSDKPTELKITIQDVSAVQISPEDLTQSLDSPKTDCGKERKSKSLTAA